MVPALGLTMTAMGAITAWGFQLSYTLFQVPAGMVGERFGARFALMLPCSDAAWPPSRRASCRRRRPLSPRCGHARPAGHVASRRLPGGGDGGDGICALGLAGAGDVVLHRDVGPGCRIAPLLMAPTMERFGWRAVFLVSGAIGAATAVAWRSLMPPPIVDALTNGLSDSGSTLRDLVLLLGNPHLRRLSLAYLLHSAVWFVFLFWFFRYLIEGRGFTVLASGVWAVSRASPASCGATGWRGRRSSRPARRRGPRPPARGHVLPARRGNLRGGGRGAPECRPCDGRAQRVVGVHQRRRGPLLRDGHGDWRGPSWRRSGGAQPDGQPRRRAVDLARTAHVGGLGVDGTLVFWSGVCVVAALLWLTVNVDSERAATIT